MKEQKYILKNQESFCLKHIFDCGQCFRWNEENDKSYTGVIKEGIINVKKQDEDITFKGMLNSDIKEIVFNYFDLNRNYEEIKNKLSKIDENVNLSIKYGEGIRILNQDLWETIISFIISANNNIPRIKGIIERLSEKYGKEVIWNEKKYYLFPRPEELKNVTVQDFRDLGTGFRDIRLFETTNKILTKEVDLQSLYNLDTKDARDELLTLSGVGPKVADCFLLFSDFLHTLRRDCHRSINL